MFEAYERENKKKLPKWLVPLLSASVVLHLAVLAALVIHGQWDIEKVSLPRGKVAIATVVPAPAPPPAKKGADKPRPKPVHAEKVDQRVVPKDTTQPVELEAPEEQAASDAEGAGDPFGDPEGVDDSTCTGPSCDPNSPIRDTVPPDDKKKKKKKKKKKTTKVIRQPELDRVRISGDTQIRPDDSSRARMSRSGRTSFVAVVKYCFDGASGRVTGAQLLKRTGDDAYDRKILATVRTWRYRPLDYDEVCTSVTFQYHLR